MAGAEVSHFQMVISVIIGQKSVKQSAQILDDRKQNKNVLKATVHLSCSEKSYSLYNTNLTVFYCTNLQNVIMVYCML